MSRIRVAVRGLLAGTAAAILAVAMIGTAAAQPYPYHRPPPRHHHRPPPPPPPAWGYDRPTYVPAPPPVVYAPEAPPAAINFGISLNLR
ncbi:MAG TPA: hypothetical protein VLV50_16485 [Stellaceae bacterium]|nr:hypothetical protein [Stellaceae bacterium]